MSFKMVEWQSADGRWYVGTPDESVKTGRGKWWFPARQMKMELTEYIKFVKSYGADNFKYFPQDENGISGDVLLFSFAKYADAHKFVLFINGKARKGGW